MDFAPILAKNLEVSKLKYGPLKKTATGAKSIYMNYDGERIAIQFPLMHMPYGISNTAELNKDANLPPNYTLNISFKGKEENKALSKLFEKIQEIEDKIKKDVFANRVAWLNDRYDDMEQVVSRLFSSNLQFDKDKETKKVLNRYPPTFRVKVPSSTERDEQSGTMVTTFKFDCMDMNNNDIDFASIKDKLKSGKAQLIVQLMGLWFAGGKYGCTWKVMSGRFQVQQGVKYNYVDDSDDEGAVVTKSGAVEEDDEDEDDHDIPVVVTKPAPAPPSKTVIPESDEEEEEEEVVEEEEEEEEEELPPPPPPPPKKVVKKAPTAKK